MVERLLLIVNRASGTGCDASLAARLLRELRSAAPGVGELELALVADHPSTRLATRAFLAGSDRPAAVIVGGGGGTLRAAVEGVADNAGGALPGADRVVLGALRMGSGNVIARRLGVPKDPIAGIRVLGAALEAGRSEPCPVIGAGLGPGRAPTTCATP
jgi:diacylglycerol kinase (ATP)